MGNERLFPRFILGMIVVLLLSSFSGCVGSQTGSYKDSATQNVSEANAKCADYLAGKGARDIQMNALCDGVKNIAPQETGQKGAAPTPKVAAGDAGVQSLDDVYKNIVVGDIHLGTPNLVWKYNETESKNIKAMAVYGQGDDFFVLIDKRDGADLDKDPTQVIFNIDNAGVKVNVGVYSSKADVVQLSAGRLEEKIPSQIILDYKSTLKPVSSGNTEVVQFYGLKKFLSDAIKIDPNYVYGLGFDFDPNPADGRDKHLDGPQVKVLFD